MVTIKPVGHFFDIVTEVGFEYAVPTAGEFGALWVEGSQSATNTDGATFDIYDGGATNIKLGFDLSDQGDATYIILAWATGQVDADLTDVGSLQFRQDTGALDGTTPSTVSGTTGTEARVYDVGGNDSGYNYFNSHIRFLPFSSADAEFGYWFVERGDVSTFTVTAGSLIVLPCEVSFGATPSFTGTSLSLERTLGGNPGTNDPLGGGADTDNESAGTTLTVIHPGQYLLMHNVRVEGPSAGVLGSYRWTLTKDDVDVFGVKTNTSTGGAVRTGRGFQQHISTPGGASKIRTGYSMFNVSTLGSGDHVYKNVSNKHDNGTDNTERLLGEQIVVVKTDSFAQFSSREDTTALLVDFDSFTDWNDGVTVAGDGSTEFMIGLSTSLHAGDAAAGLDMQITRNGSRLDTVAFSFDNPRDSGDGTTGVGDSDNATLPVSMWIVDTPDAGAATYKLQVKRAGGVNSTIMNCNDNGASGFKGTMFAAAISFAII